MFSERGEQMAKSKRGKMAATSAARLFLAHRPELCNPTGRGKPQGTPSWRKLCEDAEQFLSERGIAPVQAAVLQSQHSWLNRKGTYPIPSDEEGGFKVVPVSDIRESQAAEADPEVVDYDLEVVLEQNRRLTRATMHAFEAIQQQFALLQKAQMELFKAQGGFDG